MAWCHDDHSRSRGRHVKLLQNNAKWVLSGLRIQSIDCLSNSKALELCARRAFLELTRYGCFVRYIADCD